jgi:uncharacterized alpha-E superfamily protein
VLYVLGRDVERTEHLARLLRVHFELSIDRPSTSGRRFWSDFLQLAGWSTPEHAVRELAVRLAMNDHDGPSLRRTMESARHAAQAVRPSLSIEVWEQVNALYWRLSDAGWQGGPSDYLRQVEMGTQLVAGLVDDSMAHDEAWSFVKLGKYLERAVSVVRLVRRKRGELAEQTEDPIAWAAVLRCCGSLEAFRLRHGAFLGADEVSRFLLLDRLSPRSVGFCIGEALAAARAIDGPARESAPHRVLGRLFATFQYADPARAGSAPGDLAARFDELDVELRRALRESYFQPSRHSLDLVGDQLVRSPQQQQQRA